MGRVGSHGWWDGRSSIAHALHGALLPTLPVDVWETVALLRPSVKAQR